MNISDVIKRLENEIKQVQDESLQLEQLNRLKEIAAIYNGDDKVISSLDLAETMKNRPDEMKIMSGWSGLDNILKGFRLKQLITIAAPTKSGKTAFSIDLTSKLKQFNPLWFPFEEGAEELVQKYLDRNEQPPLFFVPQQNQDKNVKWIESKIVESIAKYGTQVVFIDHLHYIVPFSSERQDLRIGETMRELKSIAKKWNIVIFLIAHLKKTQMTTQPDLEDLRDSSFIAQESDTVIMLWRQNSKENGQVVITSNVNISVQANRRTGKTGNVKMVFNDGKFTEQEWRVEDEPLDDYSKF